MEGWKNGGNGERERDHEDRRKDERVTGGQEESEVKDGEEERRIRRWKASSFSWLVAAPGLARFCWILSSSLALATPSRSFDISSCPLSALRWINRLLDSESGVCGRLMQGTGTCRSWGGQ